MDEFRNVHIKNEHLVLNSGDEVCFLGPYAVFEDSRLDINISARGLSILFARFLNCTIHFKRQLNNFSFTGAYFERCRIKGRLSGCEFGRRDDEIHFSTYFPEAGIVDTDLSAAKLDLCRFIDCDLSTLRLPPWPCFTVLSPEEVREQALQLPWPGKTHAMLGTWHDQPAKTVAITDDARRICKEYDVTEPELRAVLSQLPGVIM